MRWVAAKVFFCLPSEEHTEKCVNICWHLRERLERNPTFLSKVSLLMRFGFIGMTQEPSNICLTGKAQ
jgi:hypothetical protein